MAYTADQLSQIAHRYNASVGKVWEDLSTQGQTEEIDKVTALLAIAANVVPPVIPVPVVAPVANPAGVAPPSTLQGQPVAQAVTASTWRARLAALTAARTDAAMTKPKAVSVPLAKGQPVSTPITAPSAPAAPAAATTPTKGS